MSDLSSPTVLEVEELIKTFNVGRNRRDRHTITAVNKVSFSVGAGESLGIVGESGSGKTTTARIIVGLENLTSGRVSVQGQDRGSKSVTSRERLRRSREVQMVFQDPYSSLDPRQSVGDSLDEILKMHFPDRDFRSRTRQLLEQVGLSEALSIQRPPALSGGQRQRVAIAKALAVEPKVLILDEALAALDVSVQAQVLNLLNDIRRDTGISYLLITHNLGVVRQISDDLLVMYHGEIVERGSTARILDSPQHPYTAKLRDAVPRPNWLATRA